MEARWASALLQGGPLDGWVVAVMPGASYLATLDFHLAENQPHRRQGEYRAVARLEHGPAELLYDWVGGTCSIDGCDVVIYSDQSVCCLHAHSPVLAPTAREFVDPTARYPTVDSHVVEASRMADEELAAWAEFTQELKTRRNTSAPQS